MRVPLMVVLAAAAALSTACASTGATPRPFPTPGGSARAPRLPGTPPAPATGATTTATGYEISGTALALRGTPYRNGGADPAGFDCSGLVSYVFAQHGTAVPRTVAEQYRVGRPVNPAQLLPGDLVFFTTTSPGASHVGIAIGGDSFVHAPSSSGVVRVERIGSSYWSNRFLGARRVF